jgi:hypothetical protein
VGDSSRISLLWRVAAWSLEGVGQRGPAWRSGRLAPSNLFVIARAIARGIRLLRRRSQREERLRSLRVHCSLRSLRLALGSRCLPHSLRRRKTCLLARSSRTAARQPGSARRRGISRRSQSGGRGISDARNQGAAGFPTLAIRGPRDFRRRGISDARNQGAAGFPTLAIRGPRDFRRSQSGRA